MLNRRDLLKKFGIGAAIVPIIGGVPEMEAKASLIEVPRVELARPVITEAPLFLQSPVSYGEFDITVIVKQRASGQVTTFRNAGILIDAKMDVVPSMMRMTFEVFSKDWGTVRES